MTTLAFLTTQQYQFSPKDFPEADLYRLQSSIFFLWLTLNNILTNDFSPAMMHQGKAWNEK